MPQSADKIIDHENLFREPEYQEMLAGKKAFEFNHPDEKIKQIVEWTKTEDYKEKNFKREALTVNPATVPMLTKEIIQVCNDQAKVVLTASEMLASMRRNITPTRAEVSDVANAVLDGTDAVVVSEEVANGQHGTKAVEVMDRIIRDIEERSGGSDGVGVVLHRCPQGCHVAAGVPMRVIPIGVG